MAVISCIILVFGFVASATASPLLNIESEDIFVKPRNIHVDPKNIQARREITVTDCPRPLQFEGNIEVGDVITWTFSGSDGGYPTCGLRFRGISDEVNFKITCTDFDLGTTNDQVFVIRKLDGDTLEKRKTYRQTVGPNGYTHTFDNIAVVLLRRDEPAFVTFDCTIEAVSSFTTTTAEPTTTEPTTTEPTTTEPTTTEPTTTEPTTTEPTTTEPTTTEPTTTEPTTAETTTVHSCPTAGPPETTTSETTEATTTSETTEAATTSETTEAATTSETTEAATTSETTEAATTSETTEAATTTSEPEPNSCRCGILGSRTRIVDGADAAVNEYPYQAALMVSRGTASSNFFCGAVLISDRHLLCAAHCTDGYVVSNGQVVSANDDTLLLTVVLGGHQMNDRFTYPWRIAVNVINHENYDAPSISNDISIIEIEPLDLDDLPDGVLPICMPTDPSNTYEGEIVTSTGWGRLASGQDQPSILQEIDLPVISNAQCRVSYGSYVLDSNICVHQPNRGTCNGDSGGPTAHIVDGQATLVGITSYGSQVCAEHPSALTRVTFYLDWIESQIGSLNTCPNN